jgi:tetratricopeptide (TPR) repeat protein
MNTVHYLRLASIFAVTLALAGCLQTSDERAEEHIASSIELAEAGDLDRSNIELLNALKLKPGNPQAIELYARNLRSQDKNRAAFRQFLRLSELNQESLVAYREMATIALEFSEYDTVETNLKEAKRLGPDDPRVKLVELALAYRQALLADDAPARRVAAQSALVMKNTLPESIIVRGMIIDNYVRDGEDEKALEEISQAQKLEPDNLALYQTRIQILARSEDFPAVEKALRDVMLKFPDNDAIKQSLIRYFLARNDLDSAESFLREQFKEGEANDPARVTLVRFLDQARGRGAARIELTSMIEEGTNDKLFKSMRATMNYEDGFRKNAIAEMQEIVTVDDSDEQTLRMRVLLARMLNEDGNDVGARNLVEQVLETDNRQVEALKLRAAWLIEQDKMDDAIVDLRTALDGAPTDQDAMTLIAQAHMRNGNRELAGETLEAAMQASGMAPNESLRYARYLATEGRFLPAEGVLIEALRATPGSGAILNELAAIYVELEDWPRAGQTERALRQLGSDEAVAMANQLQLVVLQAQDRGDEVLVFLEDLAKADDDDLGAEIAIIRSHVASGNVDLARGYLDSLMADRPNDDVLLFVHAALLSTDGRYDEAIAIYRSLLEKTPKAERVWVEMVRSLNASGQIEEADKSVDDALALVPNSANLQWMKASIYERNGDFEKALQIYDSLYNENTATSIIANNLASLLSTLRDDDESLTRAYQIARRLRDSDFAPFQDTFGWIAYRRGDYQEALRHLEPAAKTLATDPLVQYHLGTLYISMERFTDAVAQYELALSIAEDDPRPQFAAIRDALPDLREKATAEPKTVSE